MFGYIYYIKSPSNGIYIGLTTQTLKQRFSTHKGHVKMGLRKPLFNAIRKYGWENMETGILAEVEKEDIDLLNLLEQEFIADYRRKPEHHVYNLADGGEGRIGWKPSQETCRKLSVSLKKSWTEDRKNKARQTFADPEVNKRLRENQKASWTPERREKYSKMRQGAGQHNSKLDDEKVVDILHRIKAGESLASIGRLYGVTPECIGAIKHNKNWTHVPRNV